MRVFKTETVARDTRRERAGDGRSGGHRMLFAYRLGERAVFLYGFAMSEKDNIDPDELLTSREIGEKWLGSDAGMLERALHEKILMEVFDDGEKI